MKYPALRERSAHRHVKLFNRIGREMWIKTYKTPVFINQIGLSSWRELLKDMAEIGVIDGTNT